MSYDDPSSTQSQSDEFERWFFGGSPPADDAWAPHEFEAALGGAPALAGIAMLPVTVVTVDRRAANEPNVCDSMSVA